MLQSGIVSSQINGVEMSGGLEPLLRILFLAASQIFTLEIDGFILEVLVRLHQLSLAPQQLLLGLRTRGERRL